MTENEINLAKALNDLVSIHVIPDSKDGKLYYNCDVAALKILAENYLNNGIELTLSVRNFMVRYGYLSAEGQEYLPKDLCQ